MMSRCQTLSYTQKSSLEFAMITKFILHGGFARGNENEDNREFYSEILSTAPEKVHVLLVCFAKDEDRVEASVLKVKEEFNKNKEQRKLSFDLAQPGTFYKQLQQADIVYFQGGQTLKLLTALKGYPGLREYLDGKVVAGESAGANVLCSVFYSPSSGTVDMGLGYISRKIIPHYSEEYENVWDGTDYSLEPLLLREYEHRIFEVEL